MKQKVHNEWVRTLVKTTCECGRKKTQVFAWGEYHRAKWTTILHFCKACFCDRVVPRLSAHASECGCEFKLQAKSGHQIPDWIKLPPCKVSVNLEEYEIKDVKPGEYFIFNGCLYFKAYPLPYYVTDHLAINMQNAITKIILPTTIVTLVSKTEALRLLALSIN